MVYEYNKSLFTPEHEIFRDTVRRFFKEEADPHIEEWDAAGGFPKSFWKKCGDAGLLGVDIPEEYGGPGGDFLYRVVVAEELGYSPAGASIAPAVMGDATSEVLRRAGSEEQKRKWLPRMVAGDISAAMAITEPDSGSDVSAIRATAVRDGDEWVINGSKTYISNVLSADIIMVAVKTDPTKRGLSLIIVEADRPGVRKGRNLKKMGSKGAETGEIAFEDVRVPISNMMGPEGGAMSIMMGGIDIDRIMFPLIGHARATRAYEETVEFTKNRKGFGQRIFDFQNTQFTLADVKAELVVGRAFLDDVIRDFKEKGALDPLKCAVAKLWVCEMEGRVIDKCVQMHGGAGYMDEYNVSRFYTAARVHRIFAGTSEIMRLIIARTI